MDERYIVRFYNGSDNKWKDVTSPMSKAEAEQVWRNKTKSGERSCKPEHVNYYDIQLADSPAKLKYR